MGREKNFDISFFFFYILSFYALSVSFLFYSVYILLFTLQLPCMNGDPDVSVVVNIIEHKYPLFRQHL